MCLALFALARCLIRIASFESRGYPDVQAHSAGVEAAAPRGGQVYLHNGPVLAVSIWTTEITGRRLLA
jgi:hypothetical protein